LNNISNATQDENLILEVKKFLNSMMFASDTKISQRIS